MTNRKPVIEARNIRVTYPGGYTALSGVDLSIYGEEIHIILGENGAGKTTLLRVLSGSIRPSGGEIFVEGVKVAFRSPRDALRRGISMAYQGSSLIDELTVEENIYLVSNSCGIDDRYALKEIYSMLDRMGYRKIDPHAYVSSLSPAEKQLLEILMAIVVGRKAVLLDEPTSLLGPEISMEVLKIFREESIKGKAVVITTHKIREAVGLGDRFTVLRRGSKAIEVKAIEVDPKSIFEKIKSIYEKISSSVAKSWSRSARGLRGSDGDVILRARDLSVISDRGDVVLKNASFDLRGGEVVIIASLDGRGVEEIAETIYGVRKPVSGEIWVKQGSRIGYVPSNIEKASLMAMGIAINASMRRLIETPIGIKSVLIRDKDLKAYAEFVARESRITIPSLRSPMRSLSGGNARRLIIWREALRKPDLMIIEEPSANLDFGSIDLLKDLIENLAIYGCAVLIITSDPEDLVEIANRILFIREGDLVGLEDLHPSVGDFLPVSGDVGVGQRI